MRNKNENNLIFIQNKKQNPYIHNRILLLINGLKGYLNEVGKKRSRLLQSVLQ